MKNVIHTKEQAREFLKQEALNEINAISDFSNFYRNVFCIVAKYGLQSKAKEEDFFSGDEKSDPSRRGNIIERVEQFLDKFIF